MKMQRLIIQMAFAADHTGKDLQSAAHAAMQRALAQADIPAADLLGIAPEQRRWRVTLGAPRPAEVEVDALATLLPGGQGEVFCVSGGQSVTDPNTGARQDVVTAAAEWFLPRQTGWRLRS